MDIINSDDPIHETACVSAHFTSKEAAEAAKADIIATGVSYEAVKIIDDREAAGSGAGRRYLLTAHVPKDSARRTQDILACDGDLKRDG